ncbi:MAG TPA: glycyl-radical enzyme activating protein [Anaeromyxobacter sp.]|nr:glycyl-radical enzyme activating protein [Anaeromyxobacter sp.]
MGRVFDVQRFSVHDGPGIRTTLFLKGCPLRCAWCQNPEGLEGAIHLWHFPNLCASCGTCVKACSRGAISLGEAGWKLDRARCDLCGDCLTACPRNALGLDGRDLEVDEAVNQLSADRVFYDVSGGGVTFSGGDPLLQAPFVAEVARGVKALGIHTALETSLQAPWETVESLLPLIDLFLVDVKLADPERHARATGQDGSTIRENLRRLVRTLDGAAAQRLRLRVPLVPGFTADPENLAAVADLIASLDRSLSVELMNFNPLAAAKYRRMGKDHALADRTTSYSEQELAGFRAVLVGRGLSVV